ncbi:MAG: VWA domain-containing protein [Roseitalea sp.]|jgi:magnesium chelatase subunit D|nr:VWA domain-containing protein [Roseitalea sp.]MBO6723290.1 VWA domain-containing protein [Roseitalea sp.]MBO6742524.1 VWA domain-containing protein [Roseitalea sp.]
MLESGQSGFAPAPALPARAATDPADADDLAWSDALCAARLFAAAPAALGGIHVIARASPVRDRWLEATRAMLPANIAVKRITPAVPAGRLTGGIDIAATLAGGAPVHETGLLETVSGGCLTIAMAEQMTPGTAGIIARAHDVGHGGFGIVALDEGDGDEDHALPGAIADRLGLRVRLDGIAIRDAVSDTSATPLPDEGAIQSVVIPDALAETIVAVAAMLRGTSMRAPAQAMLAARILAASAGRTEATQDDVATALRLTCGAMIEAPTEETENSGADDTADDAPPRNERQRDEPETSDQDSETDPAFDPDLLKELAIAATQGARLDLDLFRHANMTRTRAQSAAGKSGAVRQGARRGRPAGLVARPPFPGARPNVVATLRTAAPWQTIRRKARGLPAWAPGEPLSVRPSDFRYVRYAHNTESTAIFAVDASGSTALERLGEAKGCVELLLADCYVRRDQVALVAFRGDGAEVLLEPTRSLVRAKRSLTALPGGGPTPLAAGLGQALDLADRARRRGQSPLIVLLTDGKGNVALDGTQDRQAARADAEEMARHAALLGVRSVIIDIARRPRDSARTLAETMHADYVTLPRADAGAMSGIVADYLKAPR